MSSAADDLQTSGPDRAAAPAGVDTLTLRQFVHQLRSHLTAIGPAAEYIAQPDIDDEVREEMSGIVCHAVDRIEGLLADLSVVAAPDGARTYRGEAAVDMGDVARAAVGSQTSYAQSIGAWLSVDASNESPPVLGHPIALKQAVTNALQLVLRLAREGDRVVTRLGTAGAGPATELDLRVELEPGEAGHDRTGEPLDFEGVAMDAARIIAEQHGGTLAGLTDRPGLVMRLPAAPLRLRPAAAAGASAGASAGGAYIKPSLPPVTG